MAPSDPNVLWTGGQRPWRTKDAAGLWKAKGPDFVGASQISAIGISPTDRRYVYLGFTNGYVAYTTNGYAGSPDWTLTSAGLPGAWVSSVAVDGQDPAVAYVTFSTIGVNHIYRTTDGGASWTSIDGIAAAGVPDIPVHSIAIRPTDSQQLYAGTEFGIFASDDGGATWDPSNAGFAHTVVEALDFRDENTLVAFTFGRGVFVTSLDANATSAPDLDAVLAAAPGLTAGPNPFRGHVELTATLPRAGHVRLSIHDVQGRLVAVVADEPLPAGRVARVWDGRDHGGDRVAAGAYFARLEGAGEVITKRVVHIR
jgi:photosystem II stability/assembly factor-like uncharacterized protein